MYNTRNMTVNNCFKNSKITLSLSRNFQSIKEERTPIYVTLSYNFPFGSDGLIIKITISKPKILCPLWIEISMSINK